MWMNSGTPKSSILTGFSIVFTIHFGVPLFLETPMWHTHGCLNQTLKNPALIATDYLSANPLAIAGRIC